MIFHYRNQRTFLFSLIILILLITSCAPATSNPTQPAATSVIPSATLPVIADTSIPSPTVNVAASPTTPSTTELSLEKECIPIEEKMPDDLILSGVWVRNQNTPYVENLDEHVDYLIPFKGGGFLDEMTISPDGKHLAYIDKYFDTANNRITKRILRVVGSSGHSLLMDYWTEDWQWIIGWIDNQHLALFTGNKEIIILNPFTGEWKKFQEPAWSKYDTGYWYLPPPYSPTLERILLNPELGKLALRNVQTGAIDWQTNHWGKATWSTNGSTLVIVSKEFMNVIKKGGQSTEFDIRKVGVDDFIYSMKLSTDDNKLILTSYPNNFFLINLNQPKITTLCANEFIIMSYRKPLVWSPDNRFAILEVYGSNYREQFDILIDTQQMRAYKLISGCCQHRIAWLAKP